MNFVGIHKKNLEGKRERTTIEFINLTRLSTIKIEFLTIETRVPPDYYKIRFMTDKNTELWQENHDTYEEALEMVLKIIGKKTLIIDDDQYF